MHIHESAEDYLDRLTKWQKVMISLGYVFIGICAVIMIFLVVRLTKALY